MGCPHTGASARTRFKGDRVRVQTGHAHLLRGEAQILCDHLSPHGIEAHPGVGHGRREGGAALGVHRDPGNGDGPALGPSQRAASAARRNVFAPRTWRNTWPVPETSPSCTTFCKRNAYGSIPMARAIISVCDSTANTAWGSPGAR